jgi:hypothetical protein
MSIFYKSLKVSVLSVLLGGGSLFAEAQNANGNSSSSKVESIDYTTKLNASTLNKNPIEQCKMWLAEAKANGRCHTGSTVISVKSDSTWPVAQAMYIKKIEPTGFVFSFVADSYKVALLSKDPKATTVSYWEDPNQQQTRQIIAEGAVQGFGAPIEKQYQINKKKQKIALVETLFVPSKMTFISEQLSPSGKWVSERVEYTMSQGQWQMKMLKDKIY